MTIERDADGLPTRFYPPQQARAGTAVAKTKATREEKRAAKPKAEKPARQKRARAWKSEKTA